jgi:glycine reductase
MDLENQTRILELVEKYGKENVMVVLGGAEAEASGLAAETVTTGDPTFAGPLTGVQLELPVYHIFELKNIIPEDVWEEQISMMEMVLDVDDIVKEVTTYRERTNGG